MPTLLYFFAPIFLTPSPSLLPPIAMQVDDAAPVEESTAEEGAIEEGTAEEGSSEEVSTEETAAEQATVEEEAPTPEETAIAAQPPPEGDPMAAQLRQRTEMMGIHRAFGIATWISMTVNVILHSIHFNDEYGGSQTETPCAQGRPILSLDYCGSSIPVPSLVSALTTSALYYTTFTLSFMMPDPLGVAESPGWAGERLRIHKALRWAHLGGMIATTIFGFVASALPQPPSADALDYGTRQAIAAVHMGLGITTYALLSAAALVILF